MHALGCNFCNAATCSSASVTVIPAPTSGSGTSVAFSGPKRYWRTMERAPSVPMSALAVCFDPSSKNAVTVSLPVVSIVLSLFPYLQTCQPHIRNKEYQKGDLPQR